MVRAFRLIPVRQTAVHPDRLGAVKTISSKQVTTYEPRGEHLEAHLIDESRVHAEDGGTVPRVQTLAGRKPGFVATRGRHRLRAPARHNHAHGRITGEVKKGGKT